MFCSRKELRWFVTVLRLHHDRGGPQRDFCLLPLQNPADKNIRGWESSRSGVTEGSLAACVRVCVCPGVCPNARGWVVKLGSGCLGLAASGPRELQGAIATSWGLGELHCSCPADCAQAKKYQKRSV